ncbi:60Kd inner membrane protein-domain-containing protein [Phyllosticta citrichinensis]|uniref:60Kd inner membrane protein-domain-containing protein n=1 Tax=Phyllosticta citrichinensis TaxID=1130410 RepID=A0ABR1XYB9_9PEZI
MMISRGLRPANAARLPRTIASSSPRSFSTNPPRLSSALLNASRKPALRSSPTASSIRTPFALGSAVSAVRFASSTSSATQSQLDAALDESVKASAEAAASAANAASSASASEEAARLASMPEHIGYLKEIGLDYGWGPTACIEWVLEHVHIYSGTGWGASIIITGLLLRLAMFKLAVNASDSAGKMSAVVDVIGPANERLKKAQMSQDLTTMMAERQRISQIYKTVGVNPLSQFLPVGAQVVLGFCTWKLLRAMASLPVPGLEHSNFLWLTDLTTGDPYFILPLAMGGFLHVIGRLGGEMAQANQMNPQMKFIMIWIMPFISVAVTASQPAAIQLAFVVTTVWGASQSFLLRSPRVRELLGITPLYKKKDDGAIDVKARSSKVQTFKYEAPKPAPGSAAYEPEHKDLYWRMKKGVKSVQESGKKSMQSAGLLRKDETGVPRRMTSKFKQQAERYEEMRQEELKRERKLSGKH